MRKADNRNHPRSTGGAIEQIGIRASIIGDLCAGINRAADLDDRMETPKERLGEVQNMLCALQDEIDLLLDEIETAANIELKKLDEPPANCQVSINQDSINKLVEDRRATLDDSGEIYEILDKTLNNIEKDPEKNREIQKALQIARDSFMNGYESGLSDMKAFIEG